MQQDSPQSFAELYGSIRERHPSIVDLDADAISEIEEESSTVRRTVNTWRYILTTFSALVFLGTFPTLAAKAYSIAVSWQEQFSAVLAQRQLLDSHPEIGISAFFLLFAVPLYTLVMSSKRFWRFVSPRLRSSRYVSHFLDIDRSKSSYIGYTLILHYAILFLPLLYSHSYEVIPERILNILTISWLLAPMLVLALFPSFFLLLVLILIFETARPGLREATPAAIIIRLVRLIHRLDNAGELPTWNNELKDRLVESITTISDLMRTMYRNIAFSHAISQWSIDQMDRAADNFMSLAAWVYFPQPATVESLKDRLCAYLNIFVSGHYDELPREEIDEIGGIALIRQRRRGLRRFVVLLSLAAYTGFPILAMVILTTSFKVDIPPLIQSPLTVLYIIWAVLGLLSFSENLSPDAKDFLMDIINSVIRRK